MSAKGAQDTKRSPRGRAGDRLAASVRGACALALLLAACVEPPRIAVPTPHGEVRAQTTEDAQALAALLNDLRPRVRALLPGTVDRPTDVWLDPQRVSAVAARESGVVAVTELPSGLIRIGEAGGIGRDFLLTHELVHALMDDSWDPLPAVMKEGLCDAIACRLAPAEAARARALRMFGARFAFGEQTLDLAVTEPSFGGRLGVSVTVAAPEIPRRDPLEALALAGHGVRLHDDFQDEDVLYGYGLLLVERAIERIGFDGLHELCLRARDEGRSVLPPYWVLWCTGLDDSAASWRLALAQAVGPDELNALSGYLDTGLAQAIVANLRYRYADFTADEFLREAQATLGLRGSPTELPVADLAPLAQQLREAWDLAEPQALRPGQSQVHSDRDGVLLGVFGRSDGGDVCTLQWVRVAAELPETARTVDGALDTATVVPDSADMEACLSFGTDERGTFLTSTLPGAFAAYRVEVHGVVVADLAWNLNTKLRRDDRGWTTITSRLDPSLQLDEAVLYGGAANVLVSQRASAGDAGEQRYPLAVPLVR